MSEHENENRTWITLKSEHVEYSLVPGGSIDIKLWVKNQGEETDFIEVGVRGIPGSWTALSTQVLQLAPEEEAELTLTVQPPPPPQTQAGIYTLKVVALSQQNPHRNAQVDVVLRVAVFETKGRIGVMMESVQFVIAPGSTATIPIMLLNHGLETDQFRLRVEGIPVNWVSTASPITSLEPGARKAIQLYIHPPRNPTSKAGRNPFKLMIASELIPEDYVEVNCILTIAAYWQFQVALEPSQAEAGAPVRIMVENQGNIDNGFALSWQSAKTDLSFEAISPFDQDGQPVGQEPGPASRSEIETIPLSGIFTLRVQPGKVESVQFRAKPAKQVVFGGETSHEYTVKVELLDKASTELRLVKGQVTSRALLPRWMLLAAASLLVMFCCLLIFMTAQARNRNISATQTAAYSTTAVIAATQTSSANQTEAAASGQKDTDGDGLIDSEEIRLGTDPNNPDTDRDELWDGREVTELRTNPLNPDSDSDRSLDGEEVLRRSTDPLNPDTDNDGLLDGQETPPCPNPLDPDSDRDGIKDGRDLDPCNTNNPSLTATAAAGQPPTQPPPTTAPPTAVQPTETMQAQPTPESTQPPSLPGAVAFASDRDGNFEIYVQNGANWITSRITNDPAMDTQPAWSSNGNRIAFVTNRDGNNEIYIMDANGSNLINISKHPGDDQFPTWSPDGRKVAFASNRDGNWEIYSVGLDGTALTNLTNNPSDDLHPYWFRSSGLLSGGEQIAFTTNRDGNNEVYSMSPDGNDLSNLTNHPASDTSPSASKNGRMIAFVSDREGQRDIFLISVNGDTLTVLANSLADESNPSWSPDDNWIAFSVSHDGNREIFIIRSNVTQLTNFSAHPASDDHPSWR